MATRRRPPEKPPIEVREFSADDIERGIAKLRRRIDDVQGLAAVRSDDPRKDVVTDAIRRTIFDIFGPNSLEFQKHEHHQIWHGGLRFNMPDREIQERFQAGIRHTVAMLEGLIARLEEAQGDLGQDAAARARTAFEGLDLHPRIATAAAPPYRDGHYANAVLNASVSLVNFIQEKSGRLDLDGANLMQTVFSANNPRLAFNALADQTDRDEQQGMMYLFTGAVLALRNPRAHRLLQDSPQEALDYIAFLSMLARQVDRAQLQR